MIAFSVNREKGETLTSRIDKPKKTKFTESKFLSILKEEEGSVRVTDLSCKHGVIEPTTYNRRSK
jgi:hypothetical protein